MLAASRAALGLAGAHQSVELVDKEDYVALLFDVLDGVLEPLLKFAAVFAAGDHAAQVQREDALAAEGFGHLAGDDELRKPLHHRALPTPGSPMRTGLFFVRRLMICMMRSISVLRPITGSSSPSCAALVRSRLYFSSTLPCPLPSSPPGAAALSSPPSGWDLAKRLQYLLLHLLRIHAHAAKQAHGHALAFLEQGQPEMLGAYEAVMQLAAFQNAALQNLFAARGQFQHAAGLDVPSPSSERTRSRTVS